MSCGLCGLCGLSHALWALALAQCIMWLCAAALLHEKSPASAYTAYHPAHRPHRPMRSFYVAVTSNNGVRQGRLAGRRVTWFPSPPGMALSEVYQGRCYEKSPASA
jgi:hypothetical protein